MLWLRELDLQGDVAGDDSFSPLDIELGQRGRVGARHHGGPWHRVRVEASTGCVDGADPGPFELERFEQGAGLGLSILGGEGQSFILGTAAGCVGRAGEHVRDGVRASFHHGGDETTGLLDRRFKTDRDLSHITGDFRRLRALSGFGLGLAELGADVDRGGLEALDFFLRFQGGEDGLGAAGDFLADGSFLGAGGFEAELDDGNGVRDPDLAAALHGEKGCLSGGGTGQHLRLQWSGGDEKKRKAEEGEAFDATVAQDYLLERGGAQGLWITSPRLQNPNTHGTGCTLSSAIAAFLAQDLPLEDAVVLAKAYVSQGIRAAVQLGHGPGPVRQTEWPASPPDFPW